MGKTATWQIHGVVLGSQSLCCCGGCNHTKLDKLSIMWPFYHVTFEEDHHEKYEKSPMVEGQELLRDLMSWCQVGASWPQFWQKKLKNCLSMQSQRDYRESATIYVVYSGGQKSSESDWQTEQWAVWYYLLHLWPRPLKGKRRAYLTKDWHDSQGGWRDLTLCHVWRKKNSLSGGRIWRLVSFCFALINQ